MNQITNFNTFSSNKRKKSSFLNLTDSLKQLKKSILLFAILLTVSMSFSAENALAQFLPVTPNPFGLDNIYAGVFISSTFVDMDGDGDLDLLVSDDIPNVYFVENIGSSTSPNYAAPVIMISPTFGFEGYITVADLDNNGTIDVLLGDFFGNHVYYPNTGTATNYTFSNIGQVNPFGLTSVGLTCSPEFVDVDGDGDFDILTGAFGNGVRYYENTTPRPITSTNITFAPAVINPFGFAAIFGTSANVKLRKVDLDRDGDMDFVYGTGYFGGGEIGFCINNGTTTAPSFVDLGSDLGLENANNNHSVSIADLDNNNSYDALASDATDELFFFRQFTDAPVISIVEGTSVSSCIPVTLNVASSNYPLSALTISWLDAAGNVVGTGNTFTTPDPSQRSLLYRAVAQTATGSRSNPTNYVQVTCNRQVVITLSVVAGYNKAQLSWEVVGSRPVTEYEVYVSFDGGTPNILYGTTTSTTYLADALLNGVNTSFAVMAVYDNGSRSVVSNTVTVRPSVVLGEDDLSAKGFAFFPNPNNGEFNIKLQDGSNSATVSVTSLSGQRVYTSTLGASQSSIDLGNIASGMYIVRVETAQGIYQQKVSVIR